MKLVPNAGRVARRSMSLWLNRLAFACLVVPEIVFLLTGRDSNPYLWGVIGVALYLAVEVSRYIDQGGLDRVRSSAGVTVAAFLAVAVPFVGGWEGKENHAYLDRIANPPVWTVCHGETNGVKEGDYYTDAECADMLEKQLVRYRDGLHAYFTPRTKAERLTPERDTAYVSLAYNVGIRGAGRSTATRRLNAGRIAAGCEALTWWNKARGRVIRGLVRRRGAEYDLCMQGIA